MVVVQSREVIEIPNVSVPTWLFESIDGPLPEQPVILDPEAPGTRSLSLRSYRHWSQRFAAGLRDIGFETGEALLFLAGNSIGWPVVMMGTLMTGGIFSGQSPLLDVGKLVHQASELEAKVIIVASGGYEQATEIARRISLSHDRVYLFDDRCIFEPSAAENSTHSSNQRHWSELLAQPANPFDWTLFTNPEQLAAVNYTSGSTGVSKGVMVSHYNLVANAAQYIQQQTHDPWALNRVRS